jgi:hypothetical protein
MKIMAINRAAIMNKRRLPRWPLSGWTAAVVLLLLLLSPLPQCRHSRRRRCCSSGNAPAAAHCCHYRDSTSAGAGKHSRRPSKLARRAAPFPADNLVRWRPRQTFKINRPNKQDEKTDDPNRLIAQTGPFLSDKGRAADRAALSAAWSGRRRGPRRRGAWPRSPPPLSVQIAAARPDELECPRG